MRSILGIVVIYNPNIDKLIYNINQYIRDIDTLIIWQNSLLTEESKDRIIGECINREKISFEGSEVNKGLDYAYNYALELAALKGYVWLLTMDQDSTWCNFKDFILSVQNRDISFGILGPNVKNVYDLNSYEKNTDCHYVLTNFVISSGALYLVSKLVKIGGFVSGYFIDAIDEEVCYRARSHGIQTVIIVNAYLCQEFGEYKKRYFLGYQIASSNYSSFRYFHIVRNHLWLIKSGLLNSNEKKLTIYNYVISPFIKVLLFEKKKIEKCVAMLRGLFAGIFKKPR